VHKYSTVPVQSSGHPLIEPTRLSGHLKGCTRSAPSRGNLEKLVGGLNGANMISALHMRRNSLFYDIMGRVRIINYPVWIFSLVVQSGSLTN
jgi:hypothetical protein